MRKYLGQIPFCILALFVSLPVHAQDQREFGRLQKPCDVTEDLSTELKRFVDVQKAEIRNPRDAREVLKLLFNTAKAGSPSCLDLIPASSGSPLSAAETKCSTAQGVNFDAQDFYAIIHVLKWNNPAPKSSPSEEQAEATTPETPISQNPPQPATQNPPAPPQPTAGTGQTPAPQVFNQDATAPPPGVPAGKNNGSLLDPGAQTVERQNWYVYHMGGWSQEDFANRKHIPGNQTVWLVYVHLNRQAPYDVSYDVAITKLLPAPWRNARDLAQLALQFRAQAANAQLAEEVWGGACIPFNSLPSQLAVTPQFVPEKETQAKSLGDVANFDNEGPYRFDFSVGVPVRKIDQLDFSSDNNKVGAKEIDKTQVFGLVDFFFRPVDFKRQTFSRYPFLVAGVALTGKPLDHGLIGLGWGTRLASIYLGASIVKEEKLGTLSTGDTATPEQVDADVHTHRKAKFAFGLLMSARGVRDMLQTNP